MSSVAPQLLAALLALAPERAVAPAQGNEAARVHFDAGRRFYQLRRYIEAVREFESGYALQPLPGFLLNIAQCYRSLGDGPHAADYYRRYLAEAPAGDGDRATVEQLLSRTQAESAGPAPTPSASPVSSLPATPELLPATTPQAVAPAPHPRRRWWIAPVVVLAAAAVAVGIGVGVSESTGGPRGGSLGTIDFAGR